MQRLDRQPPCYVNLLGRKWEDLPLRSRRVIWESYEESMRVPKTREAAGRRRDNRRLSPAAYVAARDAMRI